MEYDYRTLIDVVRVSFSIFKEAAPVIFYIGMPAIAFLALRQAKETVLAPRKQEFFKRQLDEYQHAYSALFFKGEKDLIQTLHLDRVADAIGLYMYESYLVANGIDSSTIERKIKQRLKGADFEAMGKEFGVMRPMLSLEIKYLWLFAETEEKTRANIESLSPQEQQESKHFFENRGEYPYDVIEVGFVVLPKGFINKKRKLIRFSESIFVGQSVRTLMGEYISLLNEFIKLIHKGAESAGKNIHDIHNRYAWL